MRFNPGMHHRKSIRLTNYDYSQNGLYFITICTHQRLPLFGEIVDGVMNLNRAGIMVDKIWREIPEKYSGVIIDEFVIMPNHIHGIVELANVEAVSGNHRHDVVVSVVGAAPCGRPINNDHDLLQLGQPQGVAPTVKQNRSMSLPDVAHRFKSLTTKCYIDGIKNNHWPAFNGKLWQRNYYEHIIRNEPAYLKIAEYIQTNPLKWLDDTYYLPAN